MADENALDGFDRVREQIHASDPSALATAALLREITTLKEQLQTELAGEVKVLNTKIESLEKTVDAAHNDLVRVPTDVQKAVANLQALTDEKFDRIETHLAGMQQLKDEQFRAIQQQFRERDERYTGEKEASHGAIAAALEAAKESVGKSEQSQTKTIEQQSSQIRTITDANNAQITDIKERLTRIEAIAIGQASQKQETHTSSSMIVSVIAVLLTVLSVGIAVFALTR
jgi:archaellum component FlaC